MSTTELKRYMIPYPRDVSKAKKQIIEEAAKHQEMQRYWFFSVLHSNFIWDE